MIGLRSTADLAVPCANRSRGLLALVAAGALAVTVSGCSGVAEDPSAVQEAGATSSPAEATEPAGAGSGESAHEDPAEDDPGGSAGPDTDELLTQREISQVLLTESELPFTPDTHSTLTGLDFFRDQLGAAAEVYTESFGEGECAAGMDRINADLIGERPELGVVQEYQRELADRTESLYVWMLGLEDQPDSGVIWDRVLEACAAEPLRGETDSVDVEAFEAHDFRGLQLDMEIRDGDSMVEVLGFSASVDYGRHLLMVSAANMDYGTFDAIVERQAEKLATFDHQRAD